MGSLNHSRQSLDRKVCAICLSDLSDLSDQKLGQEG